LDHTAILGNSIEEIAAEKAGIIKPGTTVVLGIMEEKASRVIQDRARGLGVSCRNVDNLLTKISTYKIPLNGVFQRDNAALAVGIVETIFNKECGYLLDKYMAVFRVSQEENCAVGCDGHCEACGAHRELSDFSTWKKFVIQRGIEETKWAGRMEVLQENPYLLVDGAHNPQGVESLFNSLKKMFPEEKFIFLTGVLADKDYAPMMEQMISLALRFLTVTVESSRSLQGTALAQELRTMGAAADSFDTLEDAMTQAMALAEATGSRIVAFGSLYFVGEVKRFMENADT
jgi:dihydrofolate synthase/folylpolyglutamate synthase